MKIMHTKNSISAKHKTSAMKIVRLAVLLFLTVQITVFAQKPTDNSRAQRDIVVLRNLMNEYFQNANPEPKKYVLSQSRSDIKYFPGFGLLISAPTYQLFN
ncbi:MAG: hypothetical protein MUD08_11520, partial [Cytophagales bacterium]|nr:hypothetical protein [Cytophagales bacterium]